MNVRNISFKHAKYCRVQLNLSVVSFKVLVVFGSIHTIRRAAVVASTASRAVIYGRFDKSTRVVSASGFPCSAFNLEKLEEYTIRTYQILLGVALLVCDLL